MSNKLDETYASVDLALRNGYQAIECDVWKTNSKDILVYHDSNLRSLCGVRKNIWKVSERSRYRYPYRNKQYGTQYILTFQEMLQYAEEKGIDIFFHLKVKNQFSKNDLKQMQRMIDKYNMRNHCYLFSSNIKTVARMKRTIHSYKGGLNSSLSTSTLKSYARSIKKKYNTKFIIFRYVRGKTDKKSLIRYCHKLRLRVCYYNLNKRKETKRLAKKGPDFLILNAPVF